jgi:hypothetical protein
MQSSPCTLAARRGDLDALKLARLAEYGWDDTCSESARGGHLEVLKWAYENECILSSWTSEIAAKAGHLDVLKWIYNKNKSLLDVSIITQRAARNGHKHLNMEEQRRLRKEFIKSLPPLVIPPCAVRSNPGCSLGRNSFRRRIMNQN